MKTFKTITFLLFFGLINLSITAQKEDDDWKVFPGSTSENKTTTSALQSKRELTFNQPPGKVSINQSSEIDSLITKISKAPFIYGYTIQIEVSQQKSVIQNAKYRMMKTDANAPFDEVYIAPNIYLYVGRFYDRLSAYEYRNKIISQFPNSTVIGPKKMDLPPLVKEEISIIAPENED
jgi:hypothetical protein